MGGSFSTIMLSHQQLLASSLQATLAPPLKAAAVDTSEAVEPEQLPEEVVKDFQRPLTRAYPVPGYFTGIRSSVVVPQDSTAVYDSLSRDLQQIFGPIAECKDSVLVDDGKGKESIQRDVKIPFKLSYFNGSINMRLHVENNRSDGQIKFQSVSRSRFLSSFCATFQVTPTDGHDTKSSQVTMDAKVAVKSLPPPPLKGLVKGLVVRKMDRCMRDLLDYHVQNQHVLRGGQAGAIQLPSVLKGHQQNVQALSQALARIHSTNRRGERRSLL